MILFVPILVLVFYLIFAKNIKLSLFSSGAIFVFVNIASTVLGRFLYGEEDRGASIILEYPIDAFDDIYYYIIAAIFSFSIGQFLVYLLFFNEGARYGANNFYGVDAFSSVVGKIDFNIVLIISFVSMLFYVYGNGLDGLFYRREYMIESSQAAKSVGSILSLACVFLLGAKSDAKAKFRHQLWISIVLALVFFIEFAAYSSRMFPIAILLFSFGFFVANKNFFSVIFLVFIIFFLPVLLHIPLRLRGLDEQGLIPLASGLFTNEFWDEFNYLVGLNNSILTNFPITILTYIHGSIDVNYLITSINPAPGSMTNWYNMVSGLNSSTPYSSSGEWLNFSKNSLLLFYFFLGGIYGGLDKISRNGDMLSATIGYMLFNMCTLTMLQYSTRASVRMLYYFLAIKLIIFFIKKLTARSFN